MTYFLFEKDPSENANIIVDWSQWLEGDTIGTSVWEIPAPLASAANGRNNTTTNAWVDGGVLGEHYFLSNTVTTVTGRAGKRTVVLRITST